MPETLFEGSGFISHVGGGFPLVDNSRFVFMIGLAVDMMFFSVLIGAFFILREGVPSWPPHDLSGLDVRTAGTEAACLFISSAFLALTVRAQHQNALDHFRMYLGAALLFLAAFLGLSVTEWRAFLVSALPLHALFGGIYATLTGLFTIHIAAAFVYIVNKFRWTLRWQRYTRSGVSLAHLSSFVTAMFVVWVGIIAVVFF